MNILVINCGSSSLKFQLINSDTEECIAKGICERIGIEGSLISYQPGEGEKEKTVTPMKDHTEAIRLVLEALTNEKTGVVKSLDEIGAVGHRIVHGGEKFAESIIINDEVEKAIEEYNRALELSNNEEQYVYIYLINSYFMLGKQEEAKQILQKLEELDSGNHIIEEFNKIIEDKEKPIEQQIVEFIDKNYLYGTSVDKNYNQGWRDLLDKKEVENILESKRKKDDMYTFALAEDDYRSEERRVGKEC